MTTSEKRIWLTNIENAADAVAAEYGSEVAQSVFQRYDAHGTHDLTYILIFVFFAHNETSLYLVKQFYKEVFVLSNVRIFKHRKRHQPFD